MIKVEKGQVEMRGNLNVVLAETATLLSGIYDRIGNTELFMVIASFIENHNISIEEFTKKIKEEITE